MRPDELATPLEARVAAFKRDPQQLRVATEFVDQLILQAKRDAELKQKEKERSKLNTTQDPGTEGGRRRASGARGLAARVLAALCHCTRAAAAAARNHSFTRR